MKITIDVPKNFSFWRTVYSHGWCALPPFVVDKENDKLNRTVELPSRKKLIIGISEPHKGVIEILMQDKITSVEKRQIINQINSCLRLDEDYSSFYAETEKHKEFQWVPKSGAGRLLRAPTVFEDVIKIICTTNCSWALTEIMVENLCSKLGSKVDDGIWTFPEPASIADVSEKFLRKEIRAGYRSPYLLELSKRIVKKNLDIESWRTSSLQTDELFNEVKSVKGIGPYAAGNILKLLGRYDYLGIDSWCRKQYFEIHRNGRKATDKVIEKHYQPFGKWRGLFFWMDVTKQWHEKKFPF